MPPACFLRAPGPDVGLPGTSRVVLWCLPRTVGCCNRNHVQHFEPAISKEENTANTIKPKVIQSVTFVFPQRRNLFSGEKRHNDREHPCDVLPPRPRHSASPCYTLRLEENPGRRTSPGPRTRIETALTATRRPRTAFLKCFLHPSGNGEVDDDQDEQDQPLHDQGYVRRRVPWMQLPIADGM